ncbi:MAG TPA: ABC transporter permease [Pyrinomonadaceae bacterium]|nr:ABC transporter permease [Pyrinomonadaceae bacterium]
MDSLIKDVRYGVRSLLKHPGFTAIAVVILALAIAATTSIFSVVNAVLLRPLPFPEPERLVVINEINPQQGPEPFELSYLNWLDLRQQSKSFEEIAGVNFASFVLDLNGEPSRVQGMGVSANLFPLLRAQAAQGRTFLPEDEKPGANRVAVVSHQFWQRHFLNQSLNGQGIKLDNQGFAIVGVMPAGFQFPDDKMDVWVPFGPDSGERFFQNRAVHFIFGLGRLKAGVTQAQAASELTTIFTDIQRAHANEDDGHAVTLTPLHERVTGDLKPALFVLLGAVIFVLLIGCANVANLQLARTASRVREMAIRVALGASRWRVIRQSLVESLLLSLIGGALGFLLAMWTITWLLLHLPEGFPRASEIGVNAAVFVFTFAVSLLTGIVFGLVPAIQAARTDVNHALKSGGKGSINSGSRLRRVLVVGEIALSLMLFIGAGLLIKSFWLLTHVNPGFQPDHLLTLHVSLPEQKYSEDAQVIEFFRKVPEQLSSLPGVKAVSAVNRLPISGGDPHGNLTIESRTFNTGEAPAVSYRRILPNYFRAMGIPLVQGREFDDRDTGGKPDVVIVNQKMAQRYWPTGDAVGKRIKIGPPEREPWLTIVGVVGNVNHTGLDTEPDLATYEPHAKRPWSSMTVLVRTNGDPLSLAVPVQRELKNAEKEILIEDVVTMNRRLDLSVAPQRMNVVLLGTFAFIALVLAAAGIYGVMAQSVAQRTQEIGLRMALGAQLRDVLTMVLRSGLSLALLGISIGLAGAFGLTRLMSKLLFGVTPTDAVTFASVAGILFVVALLACYIPARRATRVDPSIALRYE